MVDVSLDGKNGENVIIKQPSYRFESCPDYTGYLIPGSRVKAIGEFGMSREWWCKIRGTYDGGVPETKETTRMGDHVLSANLRHNSQVAQRSEHDML